MIRIVQRLEFQQVFPKEEELSAIEYLSKISKDTLILSIGFFNTTPLPNFDNWFSNPQTQRDIIQIVVDYGRNNKIYEKPETCSPAACLMIAEAVLSNQKAFIEENKTPPDRDNDELNLFKAFLVLNKELNKRYNYQATSPDNLQKLVDLSIMFTFALSDLSALENSNEDFGKLVYTTLIKIEYLLDFLDSSEDYHPIRDEFFKYFNLKNREEFNKEVKYLFGKLFELKAHNGYRFKVENEKSKEFLDSLMDKDASTDNDFTFLKLNPIFKISEGLYLVVNFFFVVDKFYRGAKFAIKDIYNKNKLVRRKYGDFFSFYNKKFSEEFLMRKLLDNICDKPYYYKLLLQEKERDNEPDYYVRYHNVIFIFENKDVMIPQDIKASSDINLIHSTLKEKFLEDEGREVGIGQLVNGIYEIEQNSFKFDDYVNKKNCLKIYPILLVHDRIFQSLGLNYQLQTWYEEALSRKLGKDYDKSRIKGLTLIDIDTIILRSSYLKLKDRNFKDFLDNHLKTMISPIKVSEPNRHDAIQKVNEQLTNKIMPISYREVPYKFDIREIVDLFRDVLKED